MPDSIAISEDTIFFIHIPKCAGTSFGTFFNDRLRPSGNFFWHGEDGDINLLAEQKNFHATESRDAIRFIGGHYTIKTAQKIIENTKLKNPVIASIIRNPFDHVFSYYNWITSISSKKGAPHPLYERCKKMTFEEFFSDPMILSEVENIQTRYLIGLDPRNSTADYIKNLSISLFEDLNPCSLQRAPVPRAPAHDFSAA